MLSVSELVKGKTVEFQYYRQGNLMYKIVGDDFEFPVPLTDTNDATFPAKEKALFFMRWIRKQVDLINSNQSGAV